MIYIVFGIIGAIIFGQTVQADFLVNMAARDDYISSIFSGTYALVILVHIPYLFFSAKE